MSIKDYVQKWQWDPVMCPLAHNMTTLFTYKKYLNGNLGPSKFKTHDSIDKNF